MTGKRKYLVIDTERCMGCCACEIACKMEYQLPKGVRFIIMHQAEEDRGEKKNLSFRFSVCRQCEEAACMESCPAGAIRRRDDGIVLVSEEDCTGCRLCLSACPYGVPVFDTLEDGREVMKKCSLCAARLDEGLPPSCVRACPAGAIRVAESK